MAKKTNVPVAIDDMQTLLHYRWYFDPPPIWIKNLSKEQWIRFSEMELELQKKELEINKERVQGLKNL
jgi:hypothetical protein